MNLDSWNQLYNRVTISFLFFFLLLRLFHFKSNPYFCPENAVYFLRLLNTFKYISDYIWSWKKTLWTLIRGLPEYKPMQEQTAMSSMAGKVLNYSIWSWIIYLARKTFSERNLLTIHNVFPLLTFSLLATIFVWTQIRTQQNVGPHLDPNCFTLW